MPLTRPNKGDPVTVEEFGQPVYDWIVANTPTAWVNATLQNGWTHAGSGPMQYRKANDVVSIRGRVDGSGPANLAIFTLPSGFRPLKEFVATVSTIRNSVWVSDVCWFPLTGEIIPMFTGSSVAIVISFSILA